MKNTLKLDNPLLINGKEVSELTYDTNEISVALFSEAVARQKMSGSSKNVYVTPVVEFDFGLHPFVGFAAIIAVNPSISFDDLERMKGYDLLKVSEIGRNFLLKSEDSGESSSDEQSETIPAPTAQALPTSTDGE